MKYSLLLLSSLLLMSCLNEPDIEPYDDTADLAYLEEYAQREDVTMTESGLLYRVIEEGEGNSPGVNNFVFAIYEGVSVDGSEQLSSDGDITIFLPSEFQFFTGFAEGLQLMNEGSTYEFVLPSNLAVNDGRVYTFEVDMDSWLLNPDEFMEQNAEREDIVVTESGLQYRIIEQGTGKVPAEENIVRLDYKGTYTNGFVFDQTTDEPVEFLLSEVISGFKEGTRLINEGGTIELFIPPAIGYGSNPPSGIIPGAILVFEIDLIEIVEETEG